MNPNSLVLERFRVGEKIAGGGFGFVYNGEDENGKPVALKFERTSNKITRPYLKHEYEVYRLLQGHPCIPSVFSYGREGKFNIMAFEQLGTSLETLFEKCGDKFSLKTTLMLAPQIIECIEYVHSKGIIHRDIKPDNFLMGKGDRANFVHIIDFGLARRYRNSKGHFPIFDGHNFFGTTRFASLKALEGVSQSRRDDLESAAYSLIYLMRGRLPWQGLRGGTEKHRDQRIREKKKNWSPDRLCAGLPVELKKMLEYVKTLGYEDEPDYEYLKGLFRDRFAHEGFNLDYDYDWYHLPIEETQEASKSLELDYVKESNKLSSELSTPESDEIGFLDKVNGHSTYKDSDDIKEFIPDMETLHLKSESIISYYADSSSHSSLDNNISTFKDGVEPNQEFLTSDISGDSYVSTALDTPVKRGDYVLIKILARETLEDGDGWSSDEERQDNSYWHNPSLSTDEWQFPWRPALVTKVTSGSAYTRLYILPLMYRPDGLNSISHARRPAFIHVRDRRASRKRQRVDQSYECALEVEPTPAWPLGGTYHYHHPENFKILVPTDKLSLVDVVWHLEEEEIGKLYSIDAASASAIFEADTCSRDGKDTQEVLHIQRNRNVIDDYYVFGDIASLNEHSFRRPGIDFSGSNGWLPEFYKINRRRNEENGIFIQSVSDADGEGDQYEDEYEESEYSGPAPGNRRLSCTLETNAEIVVEASTFNSSVAGSFYGSSFAGSPRVGSPYLLSPTRSVRSSRPGSSRGSTTSIRSSVPGSSRGSIRSSMNSPVERTRSPLNISMDHLPSRAFRLDSPASIRSAIIESLRKFEIGSAPPSPTNSTCASEVNSPVARHFGSIMPQERIMSSIGVQTEDFASIGDSKISSPA